MALSRQQLIEKLNQRLGDVKDLPEPMRSDDDVEAPEKPPKSEDPTYPIDFGPLVTSLHKTFGKEAFVRPPQENDELLCAYFDPDAYATFGHAFQALPYQEWCLNRGFAIVSKIGSEECVKVYFTEIRLLDHSEKKDGEGGAFDIDPVATVKAAQQ